MPNNDTIAHSPSDIRRRLGGLEFFQQMMAGVLPPPAMVTLLGMRLVEVGEGRVVFAAEALEAFYNGLGIAHGGFAATMLDTSLGCAINTMMPAGKVMTTLELKINYTRPLRREVGEVRCAASVIHVGKRTATSEGRIVDADGKVYAHGTTTCIVV
jgi:uncharacterized protein (TIGR00369 family)